MSHILYKNGGVPKCIHSEFDVNINYPLHIVWVITVKAESLNLLLRYFQQ
jgi:hypothetical protein